MGLFEIARRVAQCTHLLWDVVWAIRLHVRARQTASAVSRRVCHAELKGRETCKEWGQQMIRRLWYVSRDVSSTVTTATVYRYQDKTQPGGNRAWVPTTSSANEVIRTITFEVESLTLDNQPTQNDIMHEL